ncbi:hypothetical protein ABEW32_20425 [Paenibacillus jamilae]
MARLLLIADRVSSTAERWLARGNGSPDVQNGHGHKEVARFIENMFSSHYSLTIVSNIPPPYPTTSTSNRSTL